MSDLADFLMARIAEDEADARAAVDDDEHWLHIGDGGIIQGDARFAVSSGWMQLPHRYEAAEHITRWDPARVLAECEAKRRIVALHADTLDEDRGGNRFSTGCSECGDAGEFRTSVPWPCSTLQLLALPHAEHPDYREDWRPERA